MTDTLPTRAPDAVATPLPDETALERLFRTHFETLAAEARGHLGPDAAASAPRVVESAFRTAWDERERFASEQDLEVFLHQAVKRCAARELSRRAAAHHLGGSGAHAAHHAAGTSPDVDQSWAHLHGLLHPSRSGAEAAHAQLLRHDAAQHVADLTKPRPWKMPLLIGALAAAVVGGAVWYLDQLGRESAVANAIAKPDARKHETGPGRFATITLHDSSRVTLAPMSRLTVPKEFGEELRGVKLDGAATFAVRPGHAEPLQIRAGRAAVYVTGTTLHVRAFPEDPAVTVQVTEGEASLGAGEEDPRAIAAGGALVVDSAATVREPSPRELAEALGWTKTPRRLTVSDRQLRHVVSEINRWYGVDIKVPQIVLLDRPASVDVSLDSLRTAITQVERSAGVEFGYESGTMVFRAKGAQDAKRRR
ncbi:MAG TPA: FecR domain-containing protein [Gemmatimonadaceae bacterium]|nr:FecR domain-containing protein [Gemmatimonadaceae bacterium]